MRREELVKAIEHHRDVASESTREVAALEAELAALDAPEPLVIPVWEACGVSVCMPNRGPALGQFYYGERKENARNAAMAVAGMKLLALEQLEREWKSFNLMVPDVLRDWADGHGFDREESIAGQLTARRLGVWADLKKALAEL